MGRWQDMENLQALTERLHALVLFRALQKDPVIDAFLQLGEQEEKSKTAQISNAAAFLHALFQETDNLTDYVIRLVSTDENAYLVRAASNRLTKSYENALDTELTTLQALCDFTFDDLRAALGFTLPLPAYEIHPCDLKAIYGEILKNLSKTGYGIFARYHMFCVKDGVMLPVKHPDSQRLSEFSGYARERSLVIANTKALLAGDPCNNVLLYGDAGSGKSSTVKAIANEFKSEGLRLIEVKKNELFHLPDIMDALSENPLKFIIFIDDLSFAADDSDFGALKAILEGSVSGRSRNIAIYATSNRRHLVKENFSDRAGDDLHRQDTIQELTSLSARFGLKVTFSRPEKKLYEQIVLQLANQYGVEMPPEELYIQAEAHALRNGGRSPRTAKQFIEYLAYCKKDTTQP